MRPPRIPLRRICANRRQVSSRDSEGTGPRAHHAAALETLPRASIGTLRQRLQTAPRRSVVRFQSTPRSFVPISILRHESREEEGEGRSRWRQTHKSRYTAPSRVQKTVAGMRSSRWRRRVSKRSSLITFLGWIDHSVPELDVIWICQAPQVKLTGMRTEPDEC